MPPQPRPLPTQQPERPPPTGRRACRLWVAAASGSSSHGRSRGSYPGPTGACRGGRRSCCALTPASSALQHLCLPSVLTSLLAITCLSSVIHLSVCLIYLCIGSKVKLDSCACFSKIESSTSEPRASTKAREKKVGLGTRDLVLNYRGIGSAEDVSLNVC